MDNFLLDLPIEILAMILWFLPERDMLTMLWICSDLRKTLHNDVIRVFAHRIGCPQWADMQEIIKNDVMSLTTEVGLLRSIGIKTCMFVDGRHLRKSVYTGEQIQYDPFSFK